MAMRTAREATERTIRLAELHVAQQEARVEQQKRLIATLEADGHTELANTAYQLLTEMTILLARMRDGLAHAEARLMAREGR
jgi:predicted translin family RNA/ssDNA-binding protein